MPSGRPTLRLSALCACLLLIGGVFLAPLRTPTAAAVVGSDPDLEALLRATVSGAPGNYGIAVKDLTSGRSAFL